MSFNCFEDIEAWQDARALTCKIYGLTRQSDFAKDWGLKDQITRASGSIMHNIAEGFDAGTNPEFIRFLSYAQRSCTEVQSELYIAADQKYLSDCEFRELYLLAGKINAKIGGLIKYLKTHSRPK